VPVIHLSAFKKELLHLVKIGILSCKVQMNGSHQHLSPPKKMAEFVGLVIYEN
jgi:hypothetical protein